jgi:hypothetical protein
MVKVGMKTMNDKNPKPTKKYHSKDKNTSHGNLSDTIAKLEAYSKHLQSQEKSN